MYGRRVSRKRFISRGLTLGVGAAGVSALAGCGGGGAAGSRSEVPRGEAIAAEADVEPGSAAPYTVADTGRPEVLVRLSDGKFAAYSAVCTHQGCTVAYNQDSGNLACPCHGGVYDPANGAEVVSGLPPRPLPEIPSERRDGRIFRA
jgi:Rieske Fe-S protein